MEESTQESFTFPSSESLTSSSPQASGFPSSSLTTVARRTLVHNRSKSPRQQNSSPRSVPKENLTGNLPTPIRVPRERVWELPEIDTYPGVTSGSSDTSSPAVYTSRRNTHQSRLTEFHAPPPKSYITSQAAMSGYVSQIEFDQHIQSLNSHRVNTIVELRRIEKIFAQVSGPNSAEVSQPMTAAWTYYVNSHALLTELRGLTKNYPFSADCIEEAKRRVYADPESNRSWNFCWLVLNKIKTDQLILSYAHSQASMPAMWGNRTPTAEGTAQLYGAFVNEWTWALNQMLRHWDQPPRR